MKQKTVINYHIPVPSLSDALATAYDVYMSSGLQPESIDLSDGETSVRFHPSAALSVRMGDVTEAAYIRQFSLPRRVLCDEPSDE